MMWNSFGPGPSAMYGYGMHPSVWGIFGPILALWLLVAVVLKGYTLWHAARRHDLWWFIFLLIINTLGILELVYIFVVLKGFGPSGNYKEEHRHHHHGHHHHDHHDHHEHDHGHAHDHSHDHKHESADDLNIDDTNNNNS